MPSKRRTKHPSSKPSIQASISGKISGQVAIGSDIQQIQNVRAGLSSLTKAEQEALIGLIGALKEKVAAEAPADQKDAALAKVSELEKAVTSKKPDVSTMEHVRNWFVKNIPQLAGAVTGLVVNPIVGKLVEAAGETIAHEFKRRFSLGNQ